MKKLFFLTLILSLLFSYIPPQAVSANSLMGTDTTGGPNENKPKNDPGPIRPGDESDDSSPEEEALPVNIGSIIETQRQARSFDCDSVTDVSKAECLALVALYSSTNGNGWVNNENWLVSPSVSSWYGVEVGPASISLTKEANIDEFGVGDTITYTLIAENTGDFMLSDVSILDPLISTGMTCSPERPTALNPGETLECMGDYVPTQVDFDAGNVTNIATVTAEDPAGETVSAQASVTVTVEKVARIELDKTAVPVSYNEVGDEITYEFSAENLGNVTLSNVEITDPFAGLSPLTCQLDGEPVTQPVTLIPDQILVCSATYTITQADLDSGEINNTATTNALDPDEEAVSDTASFTLSAGQTPALGLEKTVTQIIAADDSILTKYETVGDQIDYAYTIRNIGNVTLFPPYAVTDDLIDTVVCPTEPTSLAPLEMLECTASYLVTQDDLDEGSVINTAVATALDAETGGVIIESEEATAEVLAEQNPSVILTKTATLINGVEPDPFVFANVGDEITYAFTIENTGNLTLTGIRIIDTLVQTQGSPIDLAPGEVDETNFTATYTVTQENLDEGEVNNTAWILWPNDPTATYIYGVYTESVLGSQTPALELTKTATLIDDAVPEPFVFSAAGDIITYSFSVENTGNVTLTDVNVTDPLTGAVNLALDPATLTPGQTGTVTQTYTVTQGDIDAGSITNAATAYGTFDSTQYSDEDETTVSGSQTASLELTKTATLINGGIPEPFAFTAVDDVITYTFSVENTGNVTLADVNVTDPLTGATNLVLDPAILAPGQTGTATATYTVTQSDINIASITNTAIAYGTFDSVQYSDEAEAVVSGEQIPALELTKTATLINDAVPEPFAYTAVDDVITYSFSVENTGNVALTDVNVTDPLTGATNLALDPATLEPGQTGTITQTYTVTQGDIDAGSITNTAIAYGTFDATEYSDEAEAVVPGEQIATLELTKTATLINDAEPDPFVYSAVDDVITYTFSVENTGNVALTDVNVTDPLTGATNLAINPAALAPGQTGTATATYTVTQDDIDAGSITNTATAYGTFDSIQYSDEDDTTVSGSQTASLELTKTATLINGAEPDPFVYSAVDDIITYTFSVENTGSVTLTDVNVTDPLTGATNLTLDPATLAPGQTGTATATYTVTQADLDAGSITNTATAYGTFDSIQYSDEDDTTVSGSQTASLELTKSATLINDAEPDPFVYSAVDDVITYSFSVENTGSVTLTDVNVTDPLTGATNLALDPATLAPGQTGTATATYTVTQADLDAGSITNTATAYGTFDSTQYSDEAEAVISGSQTISLELTKTATLINDAEPDPFVYSAVDDVITYSFSVENTGNVTLTDLNVTDPLTGATNLALDPTTLAPRQTGTATATYTVTQADLDAGSITNTATAYGTFDSIQYSDEDEEIVPGDQITALGSNKIASEESQIRSKKVAALIKPNPAGAAGDERTQPNLGEQPTTRAVQEVDPPVINYYVKKIVLNSNSLIGSLPSLELSDLTLLEVLSLRNNQLSGVIPTNIVSLINLKKLILMNNQLTGSIPAGIGQLSNLIILDLGFNQLTGPIPAQIVNLSALTELYLDSNKLTGTIPDQIDGLINLLYLRLDNNKRDGNVGLSGVLPEAMGNLTQLRWLFINSNPFIGEIPLSFTQLGNLEYFYFNNTSLCEPLVQDFIDWKATVTYWSSNNNYCEKEGENTIFLPLIIN
jgi:uncharacterized repeat protein (TIGR01451 family)